MALTTGSRTSQPNPAEDLYSFINTALTAHANWAFVEDYTVSTTKWSVWKCLAAGNSIGADFYVLFNRLTTAGALNLYTGAAETYTTGTHSYGHPVPTPTWASPLTPAADGSLGGATVYALTSTQTGADSLMMQGLALSTTLYDYWIAVGNDGLWLGSKSPSVNGVIVGTFDSLVNTPATNDPFPLMVASLHGAATQSVTSASTSRHPLVTTSQPRLWGIQSFINSSETWPAAAVYGQVGAATTYHDLFQGGKPIGARLLMKNWAVGAGNYAGSTPAMQVGWMRGLYRHLILLGHVGSVAMGDTVTVGAATYAYTGAGVQYGGVGLYYETSA